MKRWIASSAFLFMGCAVFCASIVDNAETGTTESTCGGTWVTFSDGIASITFVPDAVPGESGTYSRKLEWTFYAGSPNQYGGAVTSLNPGWTGVDCSSYKGIRFYARGYGLYEVMLGTDLTRSENNHYAKKVHVDSTWNLYELPFDQFAQTWGTPQPWDPTTVFSVTFSVVSLGGISGQVWIDDIEFYLEVEEQPVPDPNIKIWHPKVNQVGYLTGSPKYFAVTADSVSAGDTYAILNESDDIAYTGTLSGTPVNDTASTGEYVWRADFSDVNTPGTYRVSINGKESFPFLVSDSAFNPLFRDALRCFYLIRCGVAQDDPVTGISRPACHTALSTIRGTSATMDAVGGWHNACDLGLFMHETAISIAHMLWLYEMRPGTFRTLNLKTPESDNGVSDLLDQARWGLTWLLKMQDAEGWVYHKADGEPHLDHISTPDLDPYGHIVSCQRDGTPQDPSTIDAADFAGVMSQAARVFAGIDDDFASRCGEAAEKAWTWVSTHPWVGQSDPYYADPQSWQEYVWAAGEMARTLDDNGLRNTFQSIADTATVDYVSWTTPQLFGYMALYFDTNAGSDVKNLIRSKTVNVANRYISVAENSGYRVAENWWEYWWESNENIMAKAQLLLFAHEMTNQEKYRNGALAQLNYILGINSLNKCYTMSHGSNPMQHPYHWIYLYYHKPIPGWMAGGANCYTGSADVLLRELIDQGTPRAKCYYDIAEPGLGSWASNEGETSENAVLVFLTGYFYMGDKDTSVIGSVGDEEIMDIKIYPSPCSSHEGCNAVTITGLPENAMVRIFDIRGEEVFRTLTDYYSKTILWDLSDKRQLESGLYVVSVITSRGRTYQSRFILLR
jgi:endoglucanase